MKFEQVKLVPCSSCGLEIGSDADRCPRCGGANKWVHPAFQEYLSLYRDEDIEHEVSGNRLTLTRNYQNARQSIGSKLTLAGFVIVLVALFLMLFIHAGFGFLFGFGIFMSSLGSLLIGFGLSAFERHCFEVEIAEPAPRIDHTSSELWHDAIAFFSSRKEGSERARTDQRNQTGLVGSADHRQQDTSFPGALGGLGDDDQLVEATGEDSSIRDAWFGTPLRTIGTLLFFAMLAYGVWWLLRGTDQ